MQVRANLISVVCMNVADRLAEIRANLAALESRAETRRARDAETAADVGHSPKAPGKPGRKRAEDEPAMQGRDWLAEARADLARVDAAPKVRTRRIRAAVAPEYASSVDTLQRETTENRTEPTTEVGGKVVEATAGDLEDSQGAAAVPGVTASAIGSGVITALAGQGAKSPATILELRDGPPQPAATHGERKIPQARAEHWTVRMKRIDAAIMVCRMSQPAPLAGPFDFPAPVRDDPRPAAVAGCGPPGW